MYEKIKKIASATYTIIENIERFIESNNFDVENHNDIISFIIDLSSEVKDLNKNTYIQHKHIIIDYLEQIDLFIDILSKYQTINSLEKDKTMFLYSRLVNKKIDINLRFTPIYNLYNK